MKWIDLFQKYAKESSKKCSSTCYTSPSQPGGEVYDLHLLENEKRNRKKNERKNQRKKLPARVMREETGQNMKKQEQTKKNTEHEQIQQMAKKNKNETWNDFMNMGRIGYNS